MNVSEVMNPHPVTVAPDATVTEVARTMLDHRLAGVPVVDADDRLVGLVTDKDLVIKHARVHFPWYLGILGDFLQIEVPGTDEEIQRALAVTARDLMEEKMHTVSPDASVEDAATAMVDEGANPVPVVDGGRLVGMVSRMDLVRLLVVEEEDGGQDRSG